VYYSLSVFVSSERRGKGRLDRERGDDRRNQALSSGECYTLNRKKNLLQGRGGRKKERGKKCFGKSKDQRAKSRPLSIKKQGKA